MKWKPKTQHRTRGMNISSPRPFPTPTQPYVCSPTSGDWHRTLPRAQRRSKPLAGFRSIWSRCSGRSASFACSRLRATGGARPAIGPGDHRSARQNRRVGRLDRGDRQRCRPLRALAVASDLRSGLRTRPGRHHCRHSPARGDGRGRRRWLARERPVAVRQRLSACRLDARALRRDRGRNAGSPSRGARRWCEASFCRRTTGRSRTPGTSRGSRGLVAITSPSRTRGEFLRPRERRAVPARAALPERAAFPSAHTQRHLGGSRSGRLGGPCGDGRYRPAAVGGRQADARIGNVPRRAGSCRSRTERGASLARGSGHEPLAPRACRNAEGRSAPHPGHPDRDMARHDLRSRRRRMFRARRWQRAL